jgi:peptide/nickel transport system permease protein
MRRYIFLRLLQNGITYFLFLVLIFFLLEGLPGNYLTPLFGESRLTAAQLEALGNQLNLQRPLPERFADWLAGLARGDLGTSLSQYPRPVIDIIAERAPRTLMLFLAATALSFAIGFSAGKALAVRRGGRFETLVLAGGISLYTVFTPWLALVLLWIFSYALRLFPLGKFISYEIWTAGAPSANSVFLRLLLSAAAAVIGWAAVLRRTDSFPPDRKRLFRPAAAAAGVLGLAGYWILTGQAVFAVDILRHLALPVLTLTLVSFGGIMLLARAAMLSALDEEYILAAKARGLPDRVIRDRYAARAALPPVVTAFTLSLAFAVAGGVIIESVFAWEGMGYALMEAVTRSDVPLAAGILAVTGLLVLSAHLAADLLYALLDPRIRYGNSAPGGAADG